MRLIVTRPDPDAAPLIAALESAGIATLHQPVFSIRFRKTRLPELSGCQALVVTSRNGVRALAAIGGHSGLYSLPVFAVGDSSAALAREAGFADVRSADGDVNDLAALIRNSLDPAAGWLLHAAGSKVARDLGGLLAGDGYTVHREILYRAEAVRRLNDACRTALGEGKADGAVFYSPRSAITFASLVEEAGLSAVCRAMTAFCLSAAVAGAFAGLCWRQVIVSPQPRQDALMNEIFAFRQQKD